MAGLLLLGTLTSPSEGLGAASGADQGPDATTFRQLSANVNSAEPKVRRDALKALAAMGPEALDPISLLVADPVRDIRHDAILAVVAIFVEPPPKRRVQSAEDAFEWSPYLATPWALPPALVPNLVRALADDWPSERRDAAYALGVLLTPPIDARVADELTYSLADPSDEVRLAAVRALGRLRATRAGDQLIRADCRSGLVGPARRDARGGRDARSPGARRPWSAARLLRGCHCRPRCAGCAGPHRPSFKRRPVCARAVSNMAERRRSAYEGIARLGGIRDTDVVAVEQRLTEERDEPVRLAMAFALAAAGRPYLDRVMQSLADRDLADQAIEYSRRAGTCQTRRHRAVPPISRPGRARAHRDCGRVHGRSPGGGRVVPVDHRRRPVGPAGRRSGGPANSYDPAGRDPQVASRPTGRPSVNAARRGAPSSVSASGAYDRTIRP